MALVLLLGLGSGLCWGTADFFGGLQSRYLPALAVALWSQLAGGIVLALVLAIMGEPLVLESVVWGMAGGFFGGTALLLFYRGLAVGLMSIVAPVSACGALVPVAFTLAAGEVPSTLAVAGIAAAICGIVLVSLHPGPTPPGTSHARTALLLALGAALGFGFFFVFLDRGSAVSGASPLWVVGGARIGSLLMLLALAAARPRSAPWPGRRIGAVSAIGIGDTTANALFAYASTQGNLGIVAVLGSLYPVATVLLGRIILGERLTVIQHAGVALALTGVVLLAGG
jgi:drug/metabolite transporter (DMT)-like permease